MKTLQSMGVSLEVSQYIQKLENALVSGTLLRKEKPMTIGESEIDRLRKAQSDAVMDLIGEMLDAWEGLPTDVRCSDEMEELNECISRINNAMLTAGDSQSAKNCEAGK